VSVPSTTFAALRMDVAIELRDGLILTATGDGSTTTFVDALNLTDSPDQYRASHGVVISAVNSGNVGRLVRVDASSPSTSSLTFAAALPAITTTGDVLHLFNLGGYGFRPQYYDHAIQSAVRASYPDALLAVVVAGSAAFDADAPVIAIPSPLVAVSALELSEDNEEWRTVPKARQAGRWGNGWTLARATTELRIDGSWRDTADGLSYRLRGYTAHAVPSAASDAILLDHLWLLLETKARLAARRGSDRTWQQWAVEWGRIAQEQRGRIATSLAAGTEFL
jgi:hypothetical protein